ncbi:hypothetical protein AHAS_Ahas05G0198800 [Arachis hypogaea]
MNTADVDTSNSQGVNCLHPYQPKRPPFTIFAQLLRRNEGTAITAHLRHLQRPHSELLASFTTYWAACASACPWLRDRLLSLSFDNNELNVLPHASENFMCHCLTAWDLTWLAFGSVVGSGIFIITGQEARTDAGPAIVLAYAISGCSALLFALCYTEFAVDVPVASSSFSFLRIELGDFISFLAAGKTSLRLL